MVLLSTLEAMKEEMNTPAVPVAEEEQPCGDDGVVPPEILNGLAAKVADSAKALESVPVVMGEGDSKNCTFQ
jgi:hypothetical protein